MPKIAGKSIVGNHGVQNVLERLGLNTFEKRKEFVDKVKGLSVEEALKVARGEARVEKKALRPVLTGKELTPQQRLDMIERVVKYGEKVSKVCQDYQASRPIFYKWLKRYQTAPEEKKLEFLQDKKPEIKRYYHQTPEKYEEAVLSVVAQYPEFGIDKIVQALPDIAGEPIVEHHGVQNILRRHNLNTYEMRLAYAQAQVTPVTRVIAEFEKLGTQFIILPAEIRIRIIRLVSVTFLTAFSTVLVLGLFGYFATIMGAAPVASQIGLIFASIALFVGSIFFAYSMKYYLTLAIVLSFSRQPLEEGGGFAVGLNGRLNGNQKNGNGGNWLKRIFGIVNGNGSTKTEATQGFVQAGGLQPSLEHIKLKRYPFVSIHLPFYNEKKVAERILAACTSIDYPNYEVVVVDDSTDETTAIVQRFADQWNKQINTNNTNKPIIKVLHRPTRQGFKGGALRLALSVCDPRTEFVVVFDADFIPYPDTLELFIKYFKATGSWKEEQSFEVGGIKTMPYDTFGKIEISSQEKELLNRQLYDIRKKSNAACVAGYQWHVLNKSENWITRGVRTEYAGSYVIERPGQEILGALKIIHGSVYCVRADVLKHFGWGRSITEDFELTLRLYAQGFKVIYTPYIQAPSECVATLKRLIRQRMRWSEGHSYVVKKMGLKLFFSPHLTRMEKLELLYLFPYYLQAAFFLIGTFSWLMAETVFRARLPFWTSLWGWSLVLTNLLSLPLVNTVGLFLEEGETRDYLGLLSFMALSYLLVPFQAYASIKGFLEKQEGPWFRTPKTGKITDIFTRGKFYRWVSGILPGRQPAVAPAPGGALAGKPAFTLNPYLALATANNQFSNFKIRPRHVRWLGNLVFTLFIFLTSALIVFAPLLPLATVSANETGRVITGNGKEILKEKINSQIMASWEGGEAIFHQEPRIRYKFESYEIELTTLRAYGIGNVGEVKSYHEGPLFVYPEIFPSADLIYKVRQSRINESLLLKKYQPIEFLEQRLRLTDLVVAKTDNGEIVFASKTGGQDLFKFNKPYMYEEKNPGQKSEAIVYELEKRGGEYLLKKRLTEEGKKWLADPARIFPVVIDPTIVMSNVVAAGSAVAQETQFAPNQRKIAYMPNASTSNTGSPGCSSAPCPSWYAFHSDGNIIRYQKCWTGNTCDEDTDWSANVAVDSSGDAGDANPNIFVIGDDIWIAWIDNLTAGTAPYTAVDSLQWRKLTTTTDAFNTMCSTVDVGSLVYTPMAYIAAGTNGDVVVGYIDTAGDAEANIFEIPSGTSCAALLVEATYSIETGSGLCIGTCSVRPVAIGIGNNIHIVYDDAANEIRHSLRDVNGNAWTFADKVADNGNVLDDSFSVTTDSSSLWLLYRDTATTTVLQKCTGTCMSSSGTAWSNLTAPWTSGLTSADPPTITYISGTTRLKACIVDGSTTTTQNVVCRDTDASSISWGDQFSIGFTNADFVNLSSPVSVANADQMAIVVLDVTNSAFKFATVPERLLILLLLAPFLPGMLRKLKERRKLWRLA